ncbi:MAG: DinB family protein [Bacteroidetes bacterium]|nr:DinB family protein [Bacteroidota bacterium]
MKYQLKSVEQAANQILEIKKTAKDCFGKLSTEALNRKPAHDKWSAAECLEHLNLTAKGYLKNIPKEIVANSKSSNVSDEYKPRVLLKIFAEITGPDSRTKMPSPKSLISHSSSLDKTVVDDFIKIQDEFLSIIKKINMNSLKNVKVAWPALKFFKLQLGEILIMTIAHQQRHINQAKRAIKK